MDVDRRRHSSHGATAQGARLFLLASRTYDYSMPPTIPSTTLALTLTLSPLHMRAYNHLYAGRWKTHIKGVCVCKSGQRIIV